MIKEAKKGKARVNFVCQDMVEYLSEQTSGSVDLIVAMASIQHIYTRQERIRAFQHLYNVLAYGGRAVLINRSFSHWFLQKYSKQVAGGVFQSLWKSGWQRNDYIIPRK
jgi:SAM-dependent methyltransferase